MESECKPPWELCPSGKILNYYGLGDYITHVDKSKECQIALEHNEVKQSLWRLENYSLTDYENYYKQWRKQN